MKKNSIWVLFLSPFFIISCSDPVVTNKAPASASTTENKIQVLQAKPSPKKASKPAVADKKTKRAVKKKAAPIIQPPEQPPLILDISLPSNLQQPTTADKQQSYQQPAYLPDLFSNNQTEQARLHIDGSLISKQEEEAEKETSADGFGLNINLTP